jgi:hypothetical protein
MANPSGQKLLDPVQVFIFLWGSPCYQRFANLVPCLVGQLPGAEFRVERERIQEVSGWSVLRDWTTQKREATIRVP